MKDKLAWLKERQCGIGDIRTIELSKKRDIEILREQKEIYRKYKEKKDVRSSKDMSISFN